MLQRVLLELMGMKNILVINDDHCYREKPKEADDEDLKGEYLYSTFQYGRANEDELSCPRIISIAAAGHRAYCGEIRGRLGYPERRLQEAVS